ncbi:MAG: MATE family efflux transporter, partial [Thermoplasmatales archaeon]|nr:MATE family efflux transporter [Thermoplasmatales archaeon]
NLIDSAWVAGLGPDALAAVGFVFPLYFILVGVGNGVGVGAASAIGRAIGRGEKETANKIASQAVVLAIAVSILVSALLLAFQEPILFMLGAGDTIGLCLEYGTPIFLMGVFMILNGVMGGILRAEGNAKAAMNAQILMAGSNMILDPLMIYDYGLGLGIAGAAWATVAASMISLGVMIYLFFFAKKRTYITMSLKDSKPDMVIYKDILRVGIPSSLEMLIVSIVSAIMNVLLIMVGGTDSVGIYVSVWRLIMLAMIPMMAISGASVPVCAAAYGAKRKDKLRTAYFFGIKLSTLLLLVLSAILFVFAEYVTLIFTYAESTAYLRDEMVPCLRYMCLFLPFVGWGGMSTTLFQAVGKGFNSFLSTTFRNTLQLPVCYVLILTVGTLESVWWGITSMEIIGSLVPGVWSLILLGSITKGMKSGT